VVRASDALALHQAGRLAEAEAAYRAVLRQIPDDADALHGLGVLAHQQGRSAESVELIGRALAGAPGRPDMPFNLGLAQYRSGAFRAAAESFQAAANLKPDWPEAHYNLGNARRDDGDAAGAMRAFRQALRLRPAYIQAEVNLANLLKDSGKLDQALAAYRRVLARDPTLPDTHNNLGTALTESGDAAGAEAAFRAALRLRPDFPEALANLGTLLAMEGSLDRRAEAARLFTRATTLLRAAPPTLSNRMVLAECLLGLRDYEAAAANLRDAMQAYPDQARPAALLVEALRGWGKLEEAAALAENLPARDADLLTRGMLWRDLQQLDRSEAAFRTLLRKFPAQAKAKYQLAQTLLSAGQFAEGFSHFESRIVLCRPAVQPGRPWDGGAPRGRHILVVAEEGFGDAIQFARWIPRLMSRGATVTCLSAPPLHRLLARLPGAPSVADMGAKPPTADAWVLLMSLPRLMGMGDLAALGASYLTADPTGVASFRAWLPADGMRVGLTWAGNPSYQIDHLRSCPAEALAPLMHVPGVHWVSLQPGAAENAIPGGKLLLPGPRLRDLADTAALIEALDLVITVDTAMAHLAGALGRPVWLLNRFNSCWRWQTGSESSVWYHSLRQFRQTTQGDWSAPVRSVAQALQSAGVH